MMAAPSRKPAVAFRELTLGYDGVAAVSRLGGEVAQGELLALVGPNGAGKSTLLKGIAGELLPLEGRIDRACARDDVAYLPQATEIDRSFPIGVFDLVAMGLWRRGRSWGSLGAGNDTVAAALAAVGLTGFERRPIGTLSGGQMQRALFARLLLQDARLILLDEPFAAVDARTVGELLDLVGRWHQEGRTIVAALHDFDQVRRHFPRTLLIARETVAWGETGDVLVAGNLDRARTLAEAPDAGRFTARAAGTPGLREMHP